MPGRAAGAHNRVLATPQHPNVAAALAEDVKESARHHIHLSVGNPGQNMTQLPRWATLPAQRDSGGGWVEEARVSSWHKTRQEPEEGLGEQGESSPHRSPRSSEITPHGRSPDSEPITQKEPEKLTEPDPRDGLEDGSSWEGQSNNKGKQREGRPGRRAGVRPVLPQQTLLLTWLTPRKKASSASRAGPSTVLPSSSGPQLAL